MQCIVIVLCRRKFGAAVAFTNITVYLLFLLVLMALVIQFPVYTDKPLSHGVQARRLLVSSTVANSFSLFKSCYERE